MRFARLVLLALVPFLPGSPAAAQLAPPVLDFFAGQIDREIARQQQRQIQRQQQQQNNQNWQIFLAAWNDCFDKNDLARCDFALQVPNIGDDNQQRLLVKRAEIIAAIQARAEAALREQAERVAQERQRRIEAANEARRLQQEREQEAARLRQQEVERQRAEAEQAQRQRVAEERRLAGMRALVTALQGCQRFDPDSCDRALASEHSNPDRFAMLREWRAIGVAYASDQAACQAGAIDACDRALASRAVTDVDRPQLTEWRTAASPLNRAIATVSAYATAALDMAQELPGAIRDLPLSTQITGGVATMLAFALATLMIRRAPAGSTPPVPAPAPALLDTSSPMPRPRRRKLRRWLRRTYIRFLVRRRRHRIETANKAAAKTATAKDTADKAAVAAATAPIADRPRDTETAVDAMQLALAYTAEFEDNLGETLTDPAYAAKVLNTLSLISRQIEIAERADPSATVTIENDGEHFILPLSALKARAIYFEATCRMAADPKRAIRLFEQVLELTPDAANAYFWIGTLHADMLNKGAAVAAFEQAVALDPRNMEYRKELVRAQSISGAQIAYDRAASGVRTTVSIAKWLWIGFWVVAAVSFVAAILRGDPGPAIAIFAIVMMFGLAVRGVAWLKGWFASNF